MPRYRKHGFELRESTDRFREHNGSVRRVLRSYRKVGASLYQFFGGPPPVPLEGDFVTFSVDGDFATFSVDGDHVTFS